MAVIDSIINTNSVFVINEIDIRNTHVKLEVFIYKGIQGNQAILNQRMENVATPNDRPIEPTYTLEATPAVINGDNVVSFDLAPLVRDYVESELDGDHNTENAVWVDTQATIQRVVYNGIPSTLIPPSKSYLGLSGYEYVILKRNIDLNVRYSESLISNRHILQSKGEQIVVPILRSLADGYIFFDANDVELSTHITDGVDISDSDDSSEQIILYKSNLGDEPVRLYLGVEPSPPVFGEPILTLDPNATITIDQICQGRYDHTKLTFVNSYGAFQDVWFFANQKRQLKVKADSWNRRNLVVGGGAYRPTTVRNVQKVNETITLNSGFYPESNNVVFEELMQSNDVWVTVDGFTYPIIIKDSSFNFKDSNTDKTINYTIQFEYAFNKMKSL